MIPRPAVKILGLILSIACLAFFAYEAREIFANQTVSLAGSPVLRAMPIAMVPFLLAYAMLAGAWYCLLRLFGLKTPLPRALGIYLVTQIAKYLPGNVGHHIGRIYLASQHGLPAFRVGLSMVSEMFLIVLIALLFSLPLAPLLAQRAGAGAQGWSVLIYAGTAVAIVASAALYLLRHHHAVKSVRTHLVTAMREARHGPGVPFFLGAVALSAIGLAMAGISLVALFATTADLSADVLAKGIALVCVAWIAGFLTPGAPAGLGVREAILLAGLGSMFDRQTAFEATIMFRGVSVAADLVAFLCGLLLLRGLRKAQPVTPNP